MAQVRGCQTTPSQKTRRPSRPDLSPAVCGVPHPPEARERGSPVRLIVSAQSTEVEEETSPLIEGLNRSPGAKSVICSAQSKEHPGFSGAVVGLQLLAAQVDAFDLVTLFGWRPLLEVG